MKTLFLPAITGTFSNWIYYEVIMKVRDIIEFEYEKDHNGKIKMGQGNIPKKLYRIRTVEEVEEIYSEKGVSNLLQRGFDTKRLNPIKQYLIQQTDSYINNITVAIHKGSPQWLSLDLGKITSLNEKDKEEIPTYIEDSFGILQLNGDEIMFVLDGQHRVRGLREAGDESENLLDQEIAVTLITHDSSEEGKQRTRRLFSTINRHAVPVSFAENILLDEDDISAILVRRLVEEYEKFKEKEVIALGKSDHLNLPKDADRLTNVRSLWNINELLVEIDKIYITKFGPRKYLRIRPEDDKIERAFLEVKNYWNKLIKLLPEIEKFISLDREGRIRYRKENNFYFLRPIGQEIIFIIIKEFEKNGLDINKLKKIPKNLDSEFWDYVLFNPVKKTMMKKKAYARDYLKYHLGLSLKHSELNRLKKNYSKESGDLELSLPKAQLTE